MTKILSDWSELWEKTCPFPVSLGDFLLLVENLYIQVDIPDLSGLFHDAPVLGSLVTVNHRNRNDLYNIMCNDYGPLKHQNYIPPVTLAIEYSGVYIFSQII